MTETQVPKRNDFDVTSIELRSVPQVPHQVGHYKRTYGIRSVAIRTNLSLTPMNTVVITARPTYIWIPLTLHSRFQHLLFYAIIKLSRPFRSFPNLWNSDRHLRNCRGRISLPDADAYCS